MLRVGISLVLCYALVACSAVSKDKQTFDGQFFRTKASKVDSDRRQIQVSVSPVSASIEGAQEAGRHEATIYCIKNYGSSAIDWRVGPDDATDSYTFDGDTLTLRGACAG
ncbi:MAG: hypothetical protein ABJL99_17200 [Aliishimia sp.]